MSLFIRWELGVCGGFVCFCTGITTCLMDLRFRFEDLVCFCFMRAVFLWVGFGFVFALAFRWFWGLGCFRVVCLVWVLFLCCVGLFVY